MKTKPGKKSEKEAVVGSDFSWLPGETLPRTLKKYEKKKKKV